MSNFTYDLLKTKKDKIGVWLRPFSNQELYKELKKEGRIKFNEHIEKIEIVEIRNDEVCLEVWLYPMTLRVMLQALKIIKPKPTRYIVFHSWKKENPIWICEGDLGKGLK